MNNELERMCKGTVVASLGKRIWHLPGGSQENQDSHSQG